MSGKVYTPRDVADFMSRIATWQHGNGGRVIDPACGDGSLLWRYYRLTGNTDLYGVDTDESAIERIRARFSGVIPSEHFIVSDVITDPLPWRNGFDVVLGNPPYIRHEQLASEYKQRIRAIVEKEFGVEVSGRSDYYVYFFFRGLSLLNRSGTLIYITSNSWLDVGYGAVLQEFLLKRVPIQFIIEGPTRAFRDADINTAITVLKPPVEWWQTSLDNVTRFVRLNRGLSDYTDVSALLTEISTIPPKARNADLPDLASNMVNTADYRAFPILQRDLYRDGEPDGCYRGNKWGGKFLRAPDIFFTILRKGKGKLVRLGDIAEVRRGFTTGANDFFYLPSKYFDIREEGDYYKLIPKQEGLPTDIRIEKEFLKPVIKSPRECKSIIINPEDLKYKVFMCHKPKSELRGTGALKYIEWGERMRFNKRQTVLARKYWFNLLQDKISQALCMMSYNDRHIFWKNDSFLVDARLYDIYSKISSLNLVFSLNSSLTFLSVELNARTNLGEGALDFKVYEAKTINLFNPKFLK